jgi:hypothetical protein
MPRKRTEGKSRASGMSEDASLAVPSQRDDSSGGDSVKSEGLGRAAGVGPPRVKPPATAPEKPEKVPVADDGPAKPNRRKRGRSSESPRGGLKSTFEVPTEGLKGEDASALSILNVAIGKVPSVKFAIGLAGIVAAIAIIQIFVVDPRVAVFGIVIMLVLMTILFVFAKLTEVKPIHLRLAMATFLWFSMSMFVSTCFLVSTSVFFNWPIVLRHWVTGHPGPLAELTGSPSDAPRSSAQVPTQPGRPDGVDQTPSVPAAPTGKSAPPSRLHPVGSESPGLPDVRSQSGKGGVLSQAAHVEKKVKIISPEDGADIPFKSSVGEGGRVELTGESEGLSSEEVILLTVTASDRVERPQWNGPVVRPGEGGRWSSEVHVGNKDFPPERGQSFDLKAYVLLKMTYLEYRNASQSPGGMHWPPPNFPRASNATCRFSILGPKR